MIGGYFSIQRCVFLAKDWEKAVCNFNMLSDCWVIKHIWGWKWL